VVGKTFEFFSEHGRKGERFAFTLERVGWETFTEYLRENGHGPKP
jgi:dissimilatory sulfite reductase (desulfoviridin) alpha/beta subunit